MNFKAFYFKRCLNDHVLYTPFSMPENTHCQTCGARFLSICDSCGAKLPCTAYFGSPLSAKKASNFPKPIYCGKCGSKFPWAGESRVQVEDSFWMIVDPQISAVARTRFESGHFADAVEAAFKELNQFVKAVLRERMGKELDGKPLMENVLSPGSPVLVLADLNTESGKNIQQGYMLMLAGAMLGIRNPKAHENIAVDQLYAKRCLAFASLLLERLKGATEKGSE